MEIKLKPWWQSKTILLAVVQALAGVIAAAFAADPALQVTGAGAVLKSLYDIYLRFNTRTVITPTTN